MLELLAADLGLGVVGRGAIQGTFFTLRLAQAYSNPEKYQTDPQFNWLRRLGSQHRLHEQHCGLRGRIPPESSCESLCACGLLQNKSTHIPAAFLPITPSPTGSTASAFRCPNPPLPPPWQMSASKSSDIEPGLNEIDGRLQKRCQGLQLHLCA